MDQAAMEALAVSLGQPRFRGRQLFQWVHGRLEIDLARMSSLPRDFTSRLSEAYPPATAEAVGELVSADGSTRKRLLRMADGRRVETVLMGDLTPGPSPARRGERGSVRRTVCVSSQVGCALGCTFCVTGQTGFARQLFAGEIVEQVYHFERMPRSGSSGGRDGRAAGPTGEQERGRFITNIVFMGMGEPLANYEAVVAAVRLLVSPEGFGLGARHITISTAGLVPAIERLGGEGLQLGLAISLHAPNDEVRERLMPINRRYPIAEVLRAAVEYSAITGRRVSYEYALIDSVNDSPAQAWQLAHLLRGHLCHVNLIPLNRSLDTTLTPASPSRIAAFQQTLQRAHIPCTLRNTRGQDIWAACGQLRHQSRSEKSAARALRGGV